MKIKKINYLKSIVVILFCFAFTTVSAKDVYLADTGMDTNDGLTDKAPVASFSKAYSIAESGDIIHVSGMIDFSADPSNTAVPKAGITIVKNLTIQGTCETADGFDGKNKTRFLIVNDTYTLVLKNLSLKNGRYQASQGGGAILVNGGTINGDHLVFDRDTVLSASNDAMGGVIKVEKTAGLTFQNCVFSNSSANKGGAIYFQDTNKPNVNIRFENTAFISNSVMGGTGGAAVFLRLTSVSTNNTFYFVNCTMSKNSVQTTVDGGALFLYNAPVGTTVNVINCTLTDNLTAGSAGHCAGLKAFSLFMGKLNIYNSIFEGNLATQSSAYSDIVYTTAPTTNNLSIKNSIIGRNGSSVVIPAECYTGDNRFNYLTASSVAFDLISQFAAFDKNRNIYPLLSTSPAIDYGDAQYLKTLNISTDQTGTVRPFVNNKCYAGAAELIGSATPPGDGKGDAYKHLIIYGQSLSTGHQSYPVISTENVSGNYMIGDQIWINYGNTGFTSFNPLVGTISNAFKTQQNIMSRSAGTIAECPLFGAANHIQLADPGSKIVATSAGTSGMTIEQLSKESQTKTFYSDFIKSLKSASQIAKGTNSTIICPAIFWMQGEWNYQGYGEGLTSGSMPTADKDTYKSLLITLKNNMQADVQNIYGQTEKPLFITYEVGASYIKGKEQSIGMAQLEASNEYGDIVCAGSVYPMTDRGGHLDANGYRWYGEMLGKVYYKTKVLGQDFKPLQPQVISKEGTNKLKIQFLVPFKPLVFDELILPKTKDYGFEIYVNGTKQTITDIKIVDDCVYLTCAGALTGTLEVAYAGQNTAGNGNLRDSDPYQSFFKYLDLDKKNPDGSYVFPRDASETTLRPDYEPKDASGKVIYDQPYPLYNFCVSFYYKLNADEQVYVVQNLGTSEAVSNNVVGKVFCGYQGWFNCYGDGSPVDRWNHWSRGTYKSNAGLPAPGHVNFEIYPDVSEYHTASLFQTGLANLGDGQPAKLYSSFKSDVIEKHFKWMEDYGIDGVALQRFLGEIKDGVFKTNRDSIAVRMKVAAEKYHRLYYIMYDMSADDTTYFQNDWIHLEKDLKITASPYYASQNGKPVICIWGFGFNTRSCLPDNSLAIIKWLKKKGYYVIGGVPTNWRTGTSDSYPGYEAVYQAFDMISPWTVGRGSVVDNSYKSVYMQPDFDYCKEHNMDYQPVAFAGFAWSNWNGGSANQIARNRGEFFWQQLYNIKQMGIPSMYVAMFDEYDEGTAILKMADSYFAKPINQYFLTSSADGTYLSSDFYMRLVAKATRVIKGLDPLTTNVTIPYSEGPIWFRTSFESGYDAILSQSDARESSLNVSGLGNIGSPRCYVSNIGESHTGLYTMIVSGSDNSSTQSNCRFYAFDVNIPVTSDTRLSFWNCPLNENGRYISLDLLMTDGTCLKDLDATDINGLSMKPSQGRGTINVWSDNECNIGQWLAGKTIDKILIAYDQPSGTGDFSTFIDDIQLYRTNQAVTGIPEVLEKTVKELKLYPNPVSSVAKIEFIQSSVSDVSVKIYNIQGILVKSLKESSLPMGQNSISVDVSGLENGLYLVHFSNKNTEYIGRMVVKK